MSTYKKDFTIRPAEGKYLNPWDCSTMQDGQEFEVLAPFTDETPETDEAQINYQVKLETFERHIRNAYQYSNYPYVLPNIKTRWAWQEKPETK